ncbi:hypothetical protein BFP75_00540 [Maribacter sp. 4G9]|nr:hypothetical protein BFP75_00540 [Maribacter sp. 4G9]
MEDFFGGWGSIRCGRSLLFFCFASGPEKKYFFLSKKLPGKETVVYLHPLSETLGDKKLVH